MLSTNGNPPTVLVTDASRGSALAFIRSLGRKGWRVIAADSQTPSPGLRSRYASDRLLYPAPEDSPSEFADALLEAARTTCSDLIVPITDKTMLPLSAVRARFDGICKLAIPEPDSLRLAADKFQTAEVARSLGIPVPRTCLVSTVAEAVEMARALGWPVVLKPRISSLYHGERGVEHFEVCYGATPDQVAQQMRRFEGRCDVLLQEYYPGVGQGVELLLYRGQPLAAFQHERIREIPVHGGASAFRKSVPLDAELYAQSTRLLEALEWTGLAMVEFKVGREGAKLMEINGRVWGSLPLAVHSGIDFPARLAELLLDGPPAGATATETQYDHNVRSRDLELDLMWIGSVLMGKRRYPFLSSVRRRDAFRAIWELLNPRYKFDILSFDDPMPGLAEIHKIIAKFRSKLADSRQPVTP